MRGQNSIVILLYKRTILIIPLFVASFGLSAGAQEWISLFDGETLNGWQPSANKSTWRL